MPHPIPRPLDLERVRRLISLFPVTAIVGPRQCGKTTLAAMVGSGHRFDLERPVDVARLENPRLALEKLTGLIVIDEVQRAPELFATLRYLVDHVPNQKYLVLGSASGDLLRQSSESLAGRIAFHQLGGLSVVDVEADRLDTLWLRGGLPRAFLAPSDTASRLWRENFVTTFLERDIPNLGITIPAKTLRRFWIMLSHYHGQVMNFAELARSFGISDMTARRYLEILDATFMVRVLSPWHNNTKKRLIKRPKVYLRDSGIFHALAGIWTEEQLSTHNRLGASWEGFALDLVCRVLGKRDEEVFFWATHAGAELDLLFVEGGKSYGMEMKRADAPRLTKSMRTACTDLGLEHLWVVYPGAERYDLAGDITVLPLAEIDTVRVELQLP